MFALGWDKGLKEDGLCRGSFNHCYKDSGFIFGQFNGTDLAWLEFVKCRFPILGNELAVVAGCHDVAQRFFVVVKSTLDVKGRAVIAWVKHRGNAGGFSQKAITRLCTVYCCVLFEISQPEFISLVGLVRFLGDFWVVFSVLAKTG